MSAKEDLIVSGSVRADLCGGTIDLFPINLILEDVVTLNLALSLKAKVEISQIFENKLVIHSKDYQREYEFTPEQIISGALEEMEFVGRILNHFKIYKGIRLTLQSGSPPGAGLGGSSAMGVVLYKALCDWTGVDFRPREAIGVVQSIEGIILNAGVPGYQDYFPALWGGILALKANIPQPNIFQIYTKDFVQVLQKHCLLVYSGATRKSGINNWEVYKAFFDGNLEVREGLSQIAKISKKALECIQDQKYEEAIHCFAAEGEQREKLFHNILSLEVQRLRDDLFTFETHFWGVKACGAGGGGCFLVFHSGLEREKILKIIQKHEMQVLPFEIEPPLLNDDVCSE